MGGKVKFDIGIDEVRKSPVIGSLVIGMVAVPEGYQQHLHTMGVKDSKKLYPKTLLKLDRTIRNHFPYRIFKISAEELSKAENINDLEVEYIAKIIKYCYKRFEVRRIYIDCVDVSARLMKLRLQKFGIKEFDNLVIQHYADEIYPVVSAASIVAKAYSDREMSRIRKKFDCGSGEPADKKTRQFIYNSILNNDTEALSIIRKNWITYKREYNKIHNSG